MSDLYKDLVIAVSEGKTDSQFAIPDGKCIGDAFFITDSKHKIILAMSWNGRRWNHQFETYNVEAATENIQDRIRLVMSQCEPAKTNNDPWVIRIQPDSSEVAK